jgi:hypothetical protein
MRMKTVRAIAVVAMILVGVAAFGRDPALPEDPAPIQLFNGKDLSNFYTWLVDTGREDPSRVFTVVDCVDGAPAIRVSGERWGAFITKDELSDYHLTVEFRWGLLTWGDRRSRTRDSGILVHAQGADGNTGRGFRGPWMRSIEAQIIEGGVGDIILVGGYNDAGEMLTPSLLARAARDRDGEDIYDPTGAEKRFERGRINWFGRDPDWADNYGFRGRRDVESPNTQWTRLEIVCDGDKVTNIVNGTVVNAGTGASQTRGKILFQSEGAEIFFRKIELRPLRR